MSLISYQFFRLTRCLQQKPNTDISISSLSFTTRDLASIAPSVDSGVRSKQRFNLRRSDRSVLLQPLGVSSAGSTHESTLIASLNVRAVNQVPLISNQEAILNSASLISRKPQLQRFGMRSNVVGKADGLENGDTDLLDLFISALPNASSSSSSALSARSGAVESMRREFSTTLTNAGRGAQSLRRLSLSDPSLPDFQDNSMSSMQGCLRIASNSHRKVKRFGPRLRTLTAPGKGSSPSSPNRMHSAGLLVGDPVHSSVNSSSFLSVSALVS